MKDSSKTSQSQAFQVQRAGEAGLIRFGAFEVNVHERVLLEDGRPVALTPKALETLLVLLRHHGHVVSKAELLKTVWPDTFVEEGVLAQNILTLRKALGNPEWIENVPKRGYRFTAPVKLESAQEVALGRRAWAWLLGVLVVAALVIIGTFAFRLRPPGPIAEAPHIRSLAVLPFQSISHDAVSQQPSYLGLGLADVLINRMGTLPEISVRPISAVRKFSDAAPDPLIAGRKLGVDLVLDGNIQRDGDRVRVTVQLHRLVDGAALWSGKFDQKSVDLFALEDSIAGQVADGLLLHLTAGERSRLMRRYTENGEAWQAYLRGRYFWNRRTPEAYQKGVEEFQQATRIDPRYALAYAGLADAYVLLGSNPNRLLSRADAMAKGRAAALKALEQDGDLAEAHTSLAFILVHYDCISAEAEKEFQRALVLNPSYATAYQWHAFNLLVAGHPDDAVKELKKAQALDPLSLIIGADLAEVYDYMGRPKDAEAESRRVLELDPTFLQARCWLAYALTAERRHDEAVAVLDNGDLKDDGYRLATLGYVYASAGRRGEARDMLERLIRLARNDYGLAFNVASVYASMGDVEQMLPWLETAFTERSGSLLLLNVIPQFAGVRSDPRFRALTARVGLPAGK
ncbi:MAG: winged helix-turn-helix domain-containing protein [Bryobacteraceae bacterium]|jgi:DNA-binding winged helix-turn-helix (wHTH) protein/TolB-like protein/Tfp pilus assembly protein PilF